jgi:hypothetical protein
MTLNDDLAPFLEGRLADWHGLPAIPLGDVEAAFGPATERSTVELGYYPADRAVFPLAVPSGGLIVYARAGAVVMLEAIKPPAVAVLATLPAPTGVAAHEILVTGAYAPEYLYGPHGLALTVAIPFGSQAPAQIVRCRTIRRFAAAMEFGPDYYKPFEDRVHFD